MKVDSPWRRKLRRLRRRVVTAPSRFVRWRLTSSGWAYGCLLAAWCLLTWAVEWGLRSGATAIATLTLDAATVEALVDQVRTAWTVCFWAASVGLWLLLVEVGLAYALAAVWSSHRTLEIEGNPRLMRRLEKDWREASEG